MNFGQTLTDAINAKHEAEQAFNAAFAEFIATVKPLGPKKFWRLLACFTGLVRYKANRGRNNPVKDAAREFFRLAVTGQNSNDHGGPIQSWDYDDAIRFVVTWENLYARYYKVIRYPYDGSEDSANDAADALPSLGQAFYERFAKGPKLRTEQELETLLHNAKLIGTQVFGKGHDQLATGENYYRMSLTDAAKIYASTLYLTRN